MIVPMTENQKSWAEARDRLRSAIEENGLPPQFADLFAKQLGSPKAMDRMASYVRQAQPSSPEELVDEMLAISQEIEAWRRKKEGQQAGAAYNALRWYGLDEPDSQGEHYSKEK